MFFIESHNVYSEFIYIKRKRELTCTICTLRRNTNVHNPTKFHENCFKVFQVIVQKWDIPFFKN